MMGCQAAPARLFHDFCLDDHVPANHMLRRIDRHPELDSVRAQLKPFHSATGRPSADPELMMRMPIIGYSMGRRGRSGRRLSGWCLNSRRRSSPLAITYQRCTINGMRLPKIRS